MKFLGQAIVIVLALLRCANGLQTPQPAKMTRSIIRTASLATPHVSPIFSSRLSGDHDPSNKKQPSILRRIWNRLDTVENAGLGDVQLAGIFGKMKQLHGPKTYLALLLLTGARWTWLFRSPYYLLVVAFCVKWYRARYVFKIPVWDRQPNWNNIVTSREQEKDLKAFTCKTCGSTLFIAKTREFFFEGDTGIGGLGCFTCGAKGRDNFVEDRDRILEDVADLDDYFEYERPLDFVSRAERRKLMKESGGDENKANELLMARAAAEAERAAPLTPNQTINGGSKSTPETQEVVEVDDKEVNAADEGDEEENTPEPAKDVETRSDTSSSSDSDKASSTLTSTESSKPKKITKPEIEATPKTAPTTSDEDLDVLDMDAL